MTLTAYLTTNEITQEQFARRIGRTQATISRLCLGERAPSIETAGLIERATGGAVPAAVWFPENAGSKLDAHNASRNATRQARSGAK